MKEIGLSRGLKAIVDDEDFDRVNQFKWYASRPERNGRSYAKCDKAINGKPIRMLMHRFILNAPPEQGVDHADRNGLNNQRSNLRLCTQRENACNMVRTERKTSKYKGVCWVEPRPGYWLAFVSIDHKSRRIGQFSTELEAARAYNETAPKYQGPFAVLNKLPDE